MKKNFLLNVGTRYFFFLIVILVNLTSFSYSENWFISSGNYHSSKYSNLDQINDKNISNLSNAWWPLLTHSNCAFGNILLITDRIPSKNNR